MEQIDVAERKKLCQRNGISTEHDAIRSFSSNECSQVTAYRWLSA